MSLPVLLLAASAGGALWRIWDGAGLGPTWLRTLAGVALIYAAGYSATGLIGSALAAFVIWALLRGFRFKWESWKMALHFWPAMLGTVLVFFLAVRLLGGNVGAATGLLVYLPLCALAGLAWPVAYRLRLPVWTRWAEGAAGAIMIGGLTVPAVVFGVPGAFL